MPSAATQTDTSWLTCGKYSGRNLASGIIRKVTCLWCRFHRARGAGFDYGNAGIASQFAVVEFDFSSWRAARPAHARHGDHEQRLFAPASGGGAQERYPIVVHLVHGRVDVLPVSGR